ncbi:hypothetical protein [Parapedobacter sp. 10938]|uniref:hypothetical protein n=1 Tax=Parapedobacter flavus TaxID=3110225 RepID=UPI002DBC9109|nr:hypothetical protein [Parapedobacter sp. 10938]MEC3879223.1 hypothetical protein [Parapedobacter sp. 10938]
MKVHIPKIPLEALQEKELAKYRDLNDESYGEPLARKVAGKLMEHPSGLFHSHRDYCGIGLYFFEGKFTLGEVNDGMGPHPIMLTFDGKDEFIAWLADQSDQRMSLIAAVKDNYFSFKFNNQTITKTRLRYFLEADYSPDWNSYCAYLRKQ